MKGYGITLRPMVPGLSTFVQLARETEDAGFGGVYIPEAVNDALMCSLAVANATKRIDIATWIVNIYLRDPALCAIAAEMVQDAAQGRFVLGLGVSHRPALEARGIEMGNARDRLRNDTEIIRKAFNGELSMFGTKFPKPAHPIPIYFAALALETSKLARRDGGWADAVHVPAGAHAQIDRRGEQGREGKGTRARQPDHDLRRAALPAR